jgi:hypothetical protein
MNAKPTTPPEQWLNNTEWGIDQEFDAQLTHAQLLNVVTQPWQAGNTGYLRGKVAQRPLAIDVEPGYIEYAWDVVPGIKPAPAFEPGTGVYASRIELLATAYGDPSTLSREVFTSIQRGFPSEWADFARQFYALPAGPGSVVDLGDPTLVAVRYPGGEIALYNVTGDEVIKNVSGRWPALKEVRNGKSIDTTRIRLRAYSMVVLRP